MTEAARRPQAKPISSMPRREAHGERGGDLGPDEVEALDPEVVHQTDQVLGQPVRRPGMAERHGGRAAEAAHVGPARPEAPRHVRHPGVPGLAALGVAVQQHRFWLGPRVREALVAVEQARVGRQAELRHWALPVRGQYHPRPLRKVVADAPGEGVGGWRRRDRRPALRGARVSRARRGWPAAPSTSARRAPAGRAPKRIPWAGPQSTLLGHEPAPRGTVRAHPVTDVHTGAAYGPASARHGYALAPFPPWR